MVSFANTCSSIGTKLTSKRPRVPSSKIDHLECKNHKAVKKSCNFLVEQWEAFKKGETFVSRNVDWQLEAYASVVYGEICSGVTPAVVATVYKLKLLKKSRKDNSFSKKKNCGLSQLLLTRPHNAVWSNLWKLLYLRNIFEPSHEIMVLVILSVNSFFITHMCSHPVGFLVRPFVHTSCVRTAKALGRPEPALVAYVISNIISLAGSYVHLVVWSLTSNVHIEHHMKNCYLGKDWLKIYVTLPFIHGSGTTSVPLRLLHILYGPYYAILNG